MAKIIMYKTAICPYCTRAKALLSQKGVADKIEEIDIGSNPDLLSEMLEKTGGKKTVPQIFINNQYVGGCDDLYKLNDDGNLDKLLTLASD